MIAVLVALSALRVSAKVNITFPVEALATPFSGRVVVFFGPANGEPRFGPDWFSPSPMLGQDVKGAKPGVQFTVDSDKAITFPREFSTAKAGTYQVQAVLDRNLGGRTVGNSPGNLYSKPKTVEFDPLKPLALDLICDQVVVEQKFRDTELVKEFKLESKLLSAFYGRPTWMKAAVALPEGYEQGQKYPVMYEVPGFGGTHFGWSGRKTVGGTVRAGEKFIGVLLNPDCPTGHSVFADSANNGPWGAALTQELIPALEKAYPAVGQPAGRFVGGHSSGGWSSLWLQVTYPDFFGGVWSTSPDQVDFRAFQIPNLYLDSSNMFFKSDGTRVPIARVGDKPVLFTQDFSDMERPLGRGEQLGSFEGVFSPKEKDGQPASLWDRKTGAFDPLVVKAFEKFDISLILRKNWATLGPKLVGKVHVYMGDTDTFYLDGAVRLLQKELKALGSDAMVEIFPGDHGSVMTKALRDRIDLEIAQAWKKAVVKG
jgi:S-formylglutathione hydrolase FrmB